jgi:hypothetical protein
LKEPQQCLIGKTLNQLGICTTELKPDSFEIQLASHIAEVKNKWDKLVPNAHFLSSSLYEIYEQCSPQHIQYRYALVTNEDNFVFCAAFQLVEIKTEHLKARQKNDFLQYATQLMLNMQEISLLVCGNVYKENLAGFYYHSQFLNQDQAIEMLHNCIEAVNKNENCAAILLKDLPSYFQPKSNLKAQKLEDDISMEMPISPLWKSLQDYRAALGKKYAARAKKILLSGTEIVVKEMDLEEIKVHKSTLHALYSQVVHRQPFAFGTLGDSYFELLKKQLGDTFRLKGLYLHEKLIAFYSTFENGSEWEVHYIGIDYAYNQSHHLYFYIHFLVLEEAILKGKNRLSLGRTSLEAKAILGAVPHYNTTYLFFKNTLAECAFGYFKKNLSESESWKTRHPLKAEIA